MTRQAKRTLLAFLRSRRGTSAVEFALVAPAFFALIFGMEEVGRLCWTQMTLQHAVELAARCGAVNTTTCGSATQTESYAASETPGMTIPSSAFSASTSSCGYEVQASFAFTSLVPELVPFDLTLQAQSCYP